MAITYKAALDCFAPHFSLFLSTLFIAFLVAGMMQFIGYDTCF